MSNTLTAAHVRYLLALLKLHRPEGVRGLDVAEELRVTKTSVHEMMTLLILMNYVEKRRAGRLFLTALGLQQAQTMEERYRRIKTRLFAGHPTDSSADKAIFTLIADMSDECALLLQ